MDSIINWASSGPRIAFIIEGSSFVDGMIRGSKVSVVEEFVAAHSKSCFVRLSMLMKNDRRVKGPLGQI